VVRLVVRKGVAVVVNMLARNHPGNNRLAAVERKSSTPRSIHMRGHRKEEQKAQSHSQILEGFVALGPEADCEENMPC
jgi:hypothetical protein